MKKIVVLALIMLFCVYESYSQNETKKNSIKDSAEIFLAGGCFWGTEHFMKQINGVYNTEVGGAIGKNEKHSNNKNIKPAETVKVEYNPQVVSLQTILELYFMIIDPTSINKQGADEGEGYRTGIYYTDAENIPIIQNAIKELAKEYSSAIVVEVLPLDNFSPSEAKHQDYLDKNKNGYCHVNPKMFEFVKQANAKPKNSKVYDSELKKSIK